MTSTGPSSDRVSLDHLRDAFEKMMQSRPEEPFVVSPWMYSELERRGVITDGRVDMFALRREAGL